MIVFTDDMKRKMISDMGPESAMQLSASGYIQLHFDSISIKRSIDGFISVGVMWKGAEWVLVPTNKKLKKGGCVIVKELFGVIPLELI